jgi:hypothetical protein
MELNFSEIDNMTTQNPYGQFNENDYGTDNNSDKYWENSKNQEEHQTKKKKVSFNDILSNMNLVVNKKGVLQFMGSNQSINVSKQDYQYQEQYYQPQYDMPQQSQYYQSQQQEPINPSVKQSYIYNKYFKDYADFSKPAPEKKVPKTIEEYNQMVMEERIKRIEERKRIAEIKSTKLMFTTTPDNNVTQGNPRNIKPSKNNLRKMSFW